MRKANLEVTSDFASLDHNERKIFELHLLRRNLPILSL